ncbi:MAG: hypothetical protein ACLPN1_03515 [Dissulfurispiraceae bacterium]
MDSLHRFEALNRHIASGLAGLEGITILSVALIADLWFLVILVPVKVRSYRSSKKSDSDESATAAPKTIEAPTELSSLIAMLLLSAIGLWMTLEPYLKKNNDRIDETVQENDKSARHVLLNPQNDDVDDSKHIDFREDTRLAIALSTNNVVGGVDAVMIGLNSFWVGFLSAVLSFLALCAGNYVAEIFIKWRYR